MSAIVEQLDNGVTVRCADGTEIVCKPLTLKAARQIMALWNKRFAPRPVVADPQQPTESEQAAVARWATTVASARIEVVKLFGEHYPELEEHISPGDVEFLIPDFFWCATGAAVPGPEAESPLTGTPPIVNTVPSGASSPTP